MAFLIFTRTWWRKNPVMPNGLEPGPGRKTYLMMPAVETEDEARAICRADFEHRYGEGEEGRRHYDRTVKSHLGLRAEYEAL